MIDPAKVPFYGNTPDGTHCFQAACKMVLGYFLPKRSFSWEELEKMSAKKEGLSTWPQQMLISLHDLGFEVTMIEGFDGKAFIAEGEQYLKKAYGEEAAAWQISRSDIPQERQLYQAAYDAGIDIRQAIPGLSDVKRYLDKDYLVIATVNSRKLKNQPGYVGHAVVILAVNESGVMLHDPGLPPRPAVRVDTEQFLTAWADPNDNVKAFIALKLKEKP